MGARLAEAAFEEFEISFKVAFVFESKAVVDRPASTRKDGTSRLTNIRPARPWPVQGVGCGLSCANQHRSMCDLITNFTAAGVTIVLHVIDSRLSFKAG